MKSKRDSHQQQKLSTQKGKRRNVSKNMLTKARLHSTNFAEMKLKETQTDRALRAMEQKQQREKSMHKDREGLFGKMRNFFRRKQGR